MRRSAAFMLLLALLAGALGGCAQAAADSTLTFWAMGREGEVVRQLIPQFERENPGVHVRVQQLAFTAAHEKLLTGFAGDSLPDLAQLGNSWVPEFVALGALAPLDVRIKATPDIDQADFFGGIWDSNVVGGRLYGLPWYIDTRLLFYRRDLLAKVGYDHPPRDWAEWRAQMVAIKKLVGPKRFAAFFPLDEYEPLEVLGLQQPSQMLRDGGRYGNFRSADFRRALGFYLDIMAAGLAPVAATNALSNVWDEFGRGYFSFYVTGPWQIAELKRRLPADRQNIWMTAPMPGPNGPGASNAGGSSIVIFARSPRQDAAWKLATYLARPDIARKFHKLSGDLPARRSAWATPELSESPYAAAFALQLARTRPTPKVPEWERIGTEMRLVAEAAAHGRMTLDEAVTEMDRRADAILAKRRWLLERGRIQ